MSRACPGECASCGAAVSRRHKIKGSPHLVSSAVGRAQGGSLICDLCGQTTIPWDIKSGAVPLGVAQALSLIYDRLNK